MATIIKFGCCCGCDTHFRAALLRLCVPSRPLVNAPHRSRKGPMNGNYCLCIFFFRLKHRFPKFAIAFRIVGACFFGNLWLVARVPRSGASHPCAEKSEQKAHSLAYTAACRCRCRNSNLNRKYVRARIETVCTRFGAGRTQAERQEPETGNRAAPEDPTCEEKINTKVTRCVCGARQKRANDIKNRGAQEKRTHSLFTCAPLFRY